MSSHVLVWDIETIPDIKGFAAANGYEGRSDEEIRAAIGDKFPKHPYHSIICIGALIAHRDNDHWVVDALGAPHVGERSEKSLISSLVDRIAEPAPPLVTFNGSCRFCGIAQWSMEFRLLAYLFPRAKASCPRERAVMTHKVAY